ncbi:hypothetical protein DXG01_015577 [Tephrocybe rancida]|nr:hypothetical protein DXG01_015577 [Tephrocybe rancida]
MHMSRDCFSKRKLRTRKVRFRSNTVRRRCTLSEARNPLQGYLEEPLSGTKVDCRFMQLGGGKTGKTKARLKKPAVVFIDGLDKTRSSGLNGTALIFVDLFQCLTIPNVEALISSRLEDTTQQAFTAPRAV